MNQNDLNMDFTEIANKDPRTIKIVVGMTGKIDSLVAAYLLSKQGFQCIGVGIMTYNNPAYNFNLEKTCAVTEFEKIKAQCEKLGMPFYAVDAQKEFLEVIHNQMISDRLAGNSTYSCVNCHKFKLRILHEKMKKLGAHLIATGHYSKCYKNHATNNFSVHSAIDKEYDQSHLLVSVTQDVLSKLVLPLAELHKEEVLKLAKKFHFEDVVSSKDLKCYSDENEVFKYIESHVPSDFRENGSVIDAYTLIPIQEHQGVYRHAIGVIKQTDDRNQTEQKVPVRISMHEKTVTMGLPSDYQFDFVQLGLVDLHKEINRGLPLHVMARIGEDPKLIHATIYFKTNNSVVIALKEKIVIKPMKQIIFFYNKEGQGAKLLGKGEISYMGKYKPLQRTQFEQELNSPIKTDGQSQEEEKFTSAQLGFKF